MKDKETLNLEERNSISIRVGGKITSTIDSLTPPPEKEASDSFNKTVGRVAIGAGAVASMVILDKITGLGVNPLNYAWALHQVSTY